jgi:hypothetical protein
VAATVLRTPESWLAGIVVVAVHLAHLFVPFVVQVEAVITVVKLCVPVGGVVVVLLHLVHLFVPVAPQVAAVTTVV